MISSFTNLDTTNTSSRQYINITAGNTILSLRAINADNSYINASGQLQIQTGGSLNALILSAAGNATFLNSVTATSHIKSGGTASQILAADGSVITAGTNISISAGQINSTGGTMAIGGSITSAIAGSILYAGAAGVLAQTNASFFYDYTNNRLGLGTTTLGSTLQINGNAAIGYSASQAAPTNGLIISGISGFGTSSPVANYNFTVVRPSGGSGNMWIREIVELLDYQL